MAVQSHFFSVGSVVTWAEAGVGAVATQSVVEPAYGPRGLGLMRDGSSAPAALHQLLADDPQEDSRQVAMIDRAGRAAVHTGTRCIAHAGHSVGDQVSAQANIMASETVPGAMIRAYSDASGEGLAERLLAALEAAEGEGGDLRGRQSAALVIVSARATGNPLEDTPVDLRVEDHRDPLGELRRLVGMRRAYDRVDVGDQLAAAGDAEGALEEYEAAHRAQPGNAELAFWHGVALAANGREAEATEVLRPAVRRRQPLGRAPEAPAGRGPLPRRRRADRAPDRDPGGLRALSGLTMFHDRARILVRGGAGGDGVVSFRREAHVPKGGPDGGDGGRGGDVAIVSDPSLRDLSGFRRGMHFKAKRGGHGQGANKHGATPAVLEVRVPPGTVVEDPETGDRWDLLKPGERTVVARGGGGGRGNKHFATATRQSPRFAEKGLPGEERTLELQLKLSADAGLVGLPNAGKSSLLGRLTRAQPKVADYPFTTIEPVLGTLERDDRQLVLADIPGLIEGASAGAGLGHEFLAHVERCRLLVHVLDLRPLDGSDPVENYETVEAELREHGHGLARLPRLLALSKSGPRDARGGERGGGALARAARHRGVRHLGSHRRGPRRAGGRHLPGRARGAARGGGRARRAGHAPRVPARPRRGVQRGAHRPGRLPRGG